MNWTSIENALQAWVVSASGYNTAKVLWRDQNQNALVSDHIALHLSGPRVVGHDANTTKTDLLQPAGQEVELGIEGDREWTLQIEVYTGAVTTSSDAKSILSLIQTQGQLPTKRGLLEAEGLSLVDLGDVQFVPDIQEVGFQGRAIGVMRFYSRDKATEKTGYIAQAEITDLTTGDSFLAPP